MFGAPPFLWIISQCCFRSCLTESRILKKLYAIFVDLLVHLHGRFTVRIGRRCVVAIKKRKIWGSISFTKSCTVTKLPSDLLISRRLPNGYIAIVHPIVRKTLPCFGFTLGNFIFMVEILILSAAMVNRITYRLVAITEHFDMPLGRPAPKFPKGQISSGLALFHKNPMDFLNCLPAPVRWLAPTSNSSIDWSLSSP